MLKTRILTALVLLAVFVPAAIFLPDEGWWILISAVIGVAAWEWAGLAQFGKKGRLAYSLGLFACMVAFSSVLMDTIVWDAVSVFYLVGVLFWFVVVPLWLYFRWSLKGVVGLVVGLFVLTPPWMLVLFPPVRSAGMGIDPFARGFVLFCIGIAWIADIVEYFVGRKFGRHPLAPSINPEKTWEGAAGAVAAVFFCFPFFLILMVSFPTGDSDALPLLEVIGFFIKCLCGAAGLAALCILGNLFVSLLMRQANITDSDTLLPGHGGILDRIAGMLALLAAWPLPFLFIFFGMVA
jgi:phosphatidate cytidylyltransferase